MIQPVVKRDKPKLRKSGFRVLFHPFIADGIIGAVVFAVIFVMVFYAVSPKRYELQAGDIPPEPIAAPRDVEDAHATQIRIDQAREQVNDIYTLDQTIAAAVVANIEEIFMGMETVRGKAAEKLSQWEEEQRELQEQQQQEQQQEEPSEEETQNSESTAGTEPTTEAPGEVTQPLTGSEVVTPGEPDYNTLYDSSFIREMQLLLPIQLSADDIHSIIKTEQRDLNQLRQKLSDSLKEMMALGIKQEQLTEFKSNLRDDIQGMAIPNELKLLGTNIGVPRLKANLLYDPDKTTAEKNKAAAGVEKVILKKGQYIVQAGQPVTETQIEMLSELGLLEDEKVDIPLVIGVFLAVLISLSILVIYLIFFERKYLYKPLIILMMGTILCLVVGLTYAAAFFNPYLIPSAMAGILLTVLINARIGIVMNVTMALLAGLITGLQVPSLAMTMVGGMVGISMLKSIQQRSILVWSGIGVSAGNLFTVIAFELLIQGGWRGPIYSSLWGLLSGLLVAVLTLGTLPIWENLFDVVTPIKLVELGNPNQPILKRLLMETPGTYHHSIIVANLAESAAEAIGANGLLARVGSYYHDIGKLERPYFFKENQLSADNPHDRLEPELSKRIITSHATDGLELAKKYKVPVTVQDFILEHHGTTPVVYFFHKAKKQGNPDITLEDFRYPGPRPRSRETAIVMMADTTEAAVRAMTDHSPDKVEELIRKLIREKLDDRQFDDCNLTVRDMNTIVTTFTGVIGGIFHERVKYPSVDLKAEKEKNSDDLAYRQPAEPS